MRNILAQKIQAAVAKAQAAGELSAGGDPGGIVVEVPRTASHGDWSTNAAMVLAGVERKPPRALAETIVRHLEDPEGFLAGIEIAGPGFINFTLSERWWQEVLRRIGRQGPAYGRLSLGRGRRVLLEIGSINPTGPIHVGHGRVVAVGDALARVLEAAGWEVSREYYVNDAGNQMHTLGRSVLYRYYALYGRQVEFEANLYQGDYVQTLAGQLREEAKDLYLNLPEAEAVSAIYPWAAARIMDELREDMEAFKVKFDRYFSEQGLYDRGSVNETLGDLRARGHLYEADGAVWFRSTTFGDDKDRPLVKSNGEKTYITPDLAYHRDKYQRGYDLLIDVWGADHHGYIPRLKAGLEALGLDPCRLEALLVQMVSLLRDGVPVSMSTRAGEYVTLREVLNEVGVDAARFSYLLRRFDSKLDFDLEMAKRQSNENPVYYVQYAHARISSVFKKAAEEGLAPAKLEDVPLNRLIEPEEGALIKQLASFPDVVEGAAVNLEPHRLTHYLMELAGLFHPYYNRHRFIGEDPGLTQARLFLAACIRQVVANGLGMLGVNAPETM